MLTTNQRRRDIEKEKRMKRRKEERRSARRMVDLSVKEVILNNFIFLFTSQSHIFLFVLCTATAVTKEDEGCNNKRRPRSADEDKGSEDKQ